MHVFDYTEQTEAQKQPEKEPEQQSNNYVTRAEFDALAARFDALTAEKQKKKENDNAKSSV